MSSVSTSDEDVDVSMERDRIMNKHTSNDSITINNLSKVIATLLLHYFYTIATLSVTRLPYIYYYKCDNFAPF